MLLGEREGSWVWSRPTPFKAGLNPVRRRSPVLLRQNRQRYMVPEQTGAEAGQDQARNGGCSPTEPKSRTIKQPTRRLCRQREPRDQPGVVQDKRQADGCAARAQAVALVRRRRGAGRLAPPTSIWRANLAPSYRRANDCGRQRGFRGRQGRDRSGRSDPTSAGMSSRSRTFAGASGRPGPGTWEIAGCSTASKQQGSADRSRHRGRRPDRDGASFNEAVAAPRLPVDHHAGDQRGGRAHDAILSLPR
jgi:hypothetical protein